MSNHGSISGAAPLPAMESLTPQIIHTKMGLVELATWGNGPSVLALHGALGGYDQSYLLARTVASPAYRFLCISRPGYLGTPLESGRSPQKQADLCFSLMEELGIQEAGVLAISGGGPTALQLALKYPKQIRGIVMISACSRQILEAVPLRWQAMKLMAHIPGMLNMMKKRMLEDPEASAKRAIPDAELRRKTFENPEARSLYLALQSSIFSNMSARIKGTDNDIKYTHAEMDFPLEEIKVPMLVIHGVNDKIVPYEQAVHLANKAPMAELFPIDKGEHVSIFTHHAIIRPKVVDFLQKNIY